MTKDTHNTWSPVVIGALAPLTAPGWVDAGLQLLSGMDLALRDLNASGGIGGRPVELVVKDTKADPHRAVEIVEDLAHLGVVALAGEFHSVVARAVAEQCRAIGLPFLCSSAVLDALCDEPTNWVARLAPAQSHGWQIYAEFLRECGHKRIAVAADQSLYWQSGTGILRDYMALYDAHVVELDLQPMDPSVICNQLATTGATAVMVLVGNPVYFGQIVNAIRNDNRLAHVLIGAPAGQPELADFARHLESGGGAIPFLRYMAEPLTPHGRRVRSQLTTRLSAPPSFIAFEGYDTILVLGEIMRAKGASRSSISTNWSELAVEGTRGTIRLSRTPGLNIWQWVWPPVEVAVQNSGLHPV